MAIDKVGVIKLADAGQFPVTWGPLQSGTYGYDEALNNYYPYNPAKAAQVLKADGWKKVNQIWTKNGSSSRCGGPSLPRQVTTTTWVPRK
jgi:ABC-type transport system substrate-binding protein